MPTKRLSDPLYYDFLKQVIKILAKNLDQCKVKEYIMPSLAKFANHQVHLKDHYTQ